MSRKGHKVHKALRSLCSLWSESPYFIAGSTCFDISLPDPHVSLPDPCRFHGVRACGVHACYVWATGPTSIGSSMVYIRVMCGAFACPYAVPSAYSVVRARCRPCAVPSVFGAVRARCRPRTASSMCGVVRVWCRPCAVPSVFGAVRARCRPRVLPYAHTDEIMVEYLFHFTGKANR